MHVRRNILKSLGILLVVGLLFAAMPVREVEAQTTFEYDYGKYYADALPSPALAISTDFYRGTGSWSSNGNVMEFYIDPVSQLGLAGVTVDDVDSVVYRTKDDTVGGVDWGFYIYTKGTKYGWYEELLIFEPLYSISYDGDPADTWNTWDSEGSTNQIAFYDSNYTYQGFYYGATLSDIKAGSIDWLTYSNSGASSTDIDYGAQEIKYFKFGTGSGWASTFYGLLDAIELTISGTTYIIDLEELVPEVYVDDDVLCDGNLPCYATITEGLDAVAAGGTVHVGPGTYNENLVITNEVDIIGAGSGSDPISNTILQSGTKHEGTGIAINAPAFDQRATLSNMRVIEYYSGIAAGYHFTLDNVVMDNNEVGLRRGTAESGGDIIINGGGFNNGRQGWYIAASSSTASEFDDITVTGTQFNGNLIKGLYIEKISNAVFDSIEVIGSGVDPTYAWNAGIDINLKYDDFENITIKNSTISGSGVMGTATNALAPVAVTIKARDDGSYSASQASLNNVLIDNCEISGPVNALKFGEPLAEGTTLNQGPTGVVVKNTNLVAGTGQALINISQSSVMINENNTFTVGSTLLTDNFDIEDAVHHGVDRLGAGAVYWVLDNLYVPTGGTIQNAIDAGSPGDTINVATGTYAENITIDKALDLLGPNAAINPNTGTRVPEAVIVPATSDPDPNSTGSMSVVYVEVDDIMIKGFTIDGDNPTLTSGHVVNGADIDSIEGIGGYEGIGGIVVENNILQNFTYTGIEFYNYVDSSATSDNYIRYNLFQNIGDTTYNWGIGILVYNNFYADITDNVFDVVRIGVQTGNFHRANVGSTGKISNNVLNVWRLGIFHNLWYSDASMITIENNTINAIAFPGATKWNGILLSSFGNSVDTIVKDNIINVPETVTFETPGYSAGYNIWNDTTTAILTIEGGSVTGADYGVFVNNYEGYSSDGGDTAITIDGVDIDAAEIGVYVLDSPSNTNGSSVTATLLNNTISSAVTGIKVEGDTATASGDHNKINGSTTDIESSALVTLDFEENYWGSPCGPSVVIGDVTYIPWYADEAMTILRTENVSGAFTLAIAMETTEKNAIIECAAPGTTFTFETGTHSGGLGVYNNSLTFDLNSAMVGPSSPAFTIYGDDITINGPGFIDGDPTDTGTKSDFPGILVADGADNFILDGVYVANWQDGIEVQGDHTNSFKVVSSWLHDNANAGMLFDNDVTLGGNITIYGNLFKDNGGSGVQNDSSPSIDVSYNSWGDIDGPTSGDGISGLVTATPYTYSEVFVDMDPDYLAATIGVNEQSEFSVVVKVAAENLYAISYKLTYPTQFLELVSTTQGSAFDPNTNSYCLIDTSVAGVIDLDCSKLSGSEVTNHTGETITSITFKATGSGLTLNGPWNADLDLSVEESDLSSGAVGGVKVFVNNGGFGDPSATGGIYEIDDTNDGRVIITGLANFTGYIDLQGRANDSGATFTVYDQQAISTATVLADAVSASSGKYTTEYIGTNLLTIGSTYHFQVDAYLYLPTTAETATSFANGDVLDTRSLTSLSLLQLLGGDATNDNDIQIGDLSCIGGDYNIGPDICGIDGSSDVNGDGQIDIYDLVLAGGNYDKQYSSWLQVP